MIGEENKSRKRIKKKCHNQASNGLRLCCPFHVVCHQDIAASHSQAGAENRHTSQTISHQDKTHDMYQPLSTADTEGTLGAKT